MKTLDWAARLELLVDGPGPDGARATAADKRAFVAVSLTRAIREARPSSLSPAALALLGELTQEAGVVAGDPPHLLLQKLDAHLEKHAPPAWMLAGFERLMREATLAGDGTNASAAFAQFAGKAASGVLGGGGARPAGTAPGGALAQLAFRDKNQKES